LVKAVPNSGQKSPHSGRIRIFMPVIMAALMTDIDHSEPCRDE